ncbi:MAG TPA: hypothetical protein VFY10_10800 [Dehalococcoidia bacterium]|nr:hypothetical protein [Dehalococcoidia bacterium]
MKDALLILASFLACSVEMVEALTIVLAVGVTRGWRSALMGVGAGLLVLAAVVAALGPSLVNFVPLSVLQVVVGALLLIFGMQWVRKAIQRAAGVRSKHNEDQIFEDEMSELRGGVVAAGAMDWTGFVVSFKGVFLEGLEVAFIVLTFGANSGKFGLTAAGALAAFVLFTGIALVVHRPLSRVPENTIKFTVGLMLVSFGTFWSGEGIGIDWKLSDGTILVAIAVYSLVAFAMVQVLKRRSVARLTRLEVANQAAQ